MEKQKTTRVQVTLPTELVDKIDTVCEISSCSRSAFIEYTLAQSMMVYQDLVDKTASGMVAVLHDSE